MINSSFLEQISSAAYKNKGLDVSMLRLDKLHPVISGNKLFKLKYHLHEAISQKKTGILTMGGPYSNHLVATAYAAMQSGLVSTGLVRGQQPKKRSETLEECVRYGMKLIYLTKDRFNLTTSADMQREYPNDHFIAQGGYGETGASGASEILSFDESQKFDYIVAACGTGTMGAGLANALLAHQKIILISVLKNNYSIASEIELLLNEKAKKKNNLSIHFEFHLGGYARKNNQLFESMNKFYQEHGIETDFVYTGKMVYAFDRLVEVQHFPPGSNILLIHSGGLQGNRSLKRGELCFLG